MGLYGEIIKFNKYFNSLRMHEGLLVIDLKLPLQWKDKEVLTERGGKVQMKVGTSNEKFKLVSFFAPFDVGGTEILTEEIFAILKWNKDQEEKNELLNIKMVELKKVFNENKVDALRNLNIAFDNKLEINGEELNTLVEKGDSKG
eukprot:SAG11_NODE_62_length_19006_cov_6.513143_32_plen_145_part_00